MVTLMLVVNIINSKTGLRENFAVFNGSEGSIDKMKACWKLIQARCPEIEAFRINSISGSLHDNEKEFVSNLVKELEKINA